jgi:DDE superfamily endonuclease
MKFENLKNAPDHVFRRITGIKRSTFKVMVNLLSQALLIKKARGGRPYKLSIENILLMTLEYLPEYRTYATIGISYGLSESNTYKAIIWAESVLAASKEFRLPGKKALLNTDMELEVILIDATESRIQRPKKTAEVLLWKEKTALSKNSGCC